MTTSLENGYNVSAVPTQMAEEAWPAVQHLLVEALEYGFGYMPEDVLAKIKQGMATLWVIEKDMQIVAACVTEIVVYPRCNSLFIWLLGGADFQEWKEALASLEMYARHNRCEYMEAVGRIGMKRMLADLGFNSPRALCAKKIDHSTH